MEVDGGIDAETAPLVVAAGANVLVAGTAIFSASEEVAAGMDRFQARIKVVEPTSTSRVTISAKE